MRNRKPLILVLLLISTTFIAANNLITNPGFEEWSSGWKKKEISGFAEVSIDENYAFEGWGSAKIEAITLAEAYWETKEAYIVEEGQEFALSASVRTEFVQGGDGAVAIAYFEDAFGRKIAENVILNLAATNDWKELSQLIKVPAGATYMKVRLGLRGASGTVCWDQIFLSNEAEAIRNARAKAEQKISINEGFDEGLKGWRTIDREGKLEYATDEKVKYSGRNAVKLASNDDKARGWIQKAFEIEGGKSYTIKVWGKTNEVSVSAALSIQTMSNLQWRGTPFKLISLVILFFRSSLGQ